MPARLASKTRSTSALVTVILTAVAVLAGAAALTGVLAGAACASSESRARRAYVASIPLKGPYIQKALVERGIEILALTKGGFVDVLVDEEGLRFVRTLGVPVSVIESPDMPSRAAEAIDENLGLYHTYAEMESVLNALESAYPALAEVSVMGTSIEGRNIYVIKISDNVLVDEDEPEVFYNGCHHARELMSVDIPLRFAVYLLENYGVDADVTDMVDSREIFIAPMLNPDGHYYVQMNHSDPNPNTWWRKNRRYNTDGSYGIDLNRNYGYMWGYDNIGSSPTPSSGIYRGTGPFSEPETQAVRNFCNGRNFVFAMSYHSYGELLLYPWGYASLPTPDHALFVALGDTLTSSNGYEAGTAPGLLYTVNGGSDDWLYGDTTQKNKIFAFTAEVNSSAQGGFAPAESYIQPTFDLLLRMNMDFLRFADNPYRLLPPLRPFQYAIDDASLPYYTVVWSAGAPSDPNPAVSWDVMEYKNLGTIAQDPANAVSDLWTFNGFTVSTARKVEGTGSYYSGQQNNASRTLEMSTFYRVTAETDTFSAWVWYSIESDYDYAYCEKSADGGMTWQTLPGNITTNHNPNGTNRGNGITGSSGGWVLAVFPLTAYVGEELELRFNYVTDPYVLGEGLYIDLPGPVSTYEAKTLVAFAHPDTTLSVAPQETAEFTYRVRARDAENHASLWSVSRSIAIDDITGVGDVPALASRLGANYPNPFNPSTRIPFVVGAREGAGGPAPVTLTIYDAAGRRVAALVDRALPPGMHEAVWDGRGDGGAPVSSGVYFARLTVGENGAFTRKLVLLK